MSERQRRKAESRDDILRTAARELRERGPDGLTVAEVMRGAGLTHGGFYAHFENKAALNAAALRHGVGETRALWFKDLDGAQGAELLTWLARRYLNQAHLKDPGGGCPFAALAAHAARDGDLRAAYTDELRQTIEQIVSRLQPDGSVEDAAVLDDTLAFLALCVGGIALARATDDAELSNRLLRACRSAAARLADNA